MKPKRIKERPFACKATEPTRIISISSFVNRAMICEGKIAATKPNTTQNMVDQRIEVLIASCSRSNFFAP